MVNRSVAFDTLVLPTDNGSRKFVLSLSSSRPYPLKTQAWLKKASVPEFNEYTERVKLFLQQPHGRKAIMLGGIVWRIVMEFLGQDAVRRVMIGPSVDVFRHGINYLDSNKVQYWDDDLTMDELNLICGVYDIDVGNGQDSKFSWFPPYNHWNTGSLNHGQWSTRAEQWFRRRMDAILTGDVQRSKDHSRLVAVADWRNRLDFIKKSKAMHRHIKKVSAAFLSDPLPNTAGKMF
ncbi:hypothetical protein LXA43DRAFT_879804 [Ganoderma leucocontextum]|nr:hypothetical protein LXA43DRAFT_879804 [Ganoderma leucocontextum]